MSNHRRLSPSARYRWAACPGSVRECAKYAEGSTSSPAAIDGTHSHTLLQVSIESGQAPDAFIGETLFDQEGEFVVDQVRADRVRVATSYIQGRVEYLGTGTVVLSEQWVNPETLLGRADMAGTVDVQIWSPDRSFVELIDYKDGMNKVEACENEQLELYSYGVLAAVKTPPKIVRMTIIQPKLAVTGQTPITTWDLAFNDFLGERMRRIIAQAEATDDPDAPLIPGEKQCRYCTHRGNCSAANRDALKGIKFENFDVAKGAAETEPELLPDDELREIIESAPLLRKMIEAAEAEALRRITSGHEIPGIKVVRGPGRRTWKQSEDEIAEALKKMRVPKDVIWRTVLVSPAQIEKAKWERRNGETHQLSARQLKTLNAELVGKTTGSLTVVPESDRRDAETFGSMEKLFGPSGDDVPDWMSA